MRPMTIGLMRTAAFRLASSSFRTCGTHSILCGAKEQMASPSCYRSDYTTGSLEGREDAQALLSFLITCEPLTMSGSVPEPKLRNIGTNSILFRRIRFRRYDRAG